MGFAIGSQMKGENEKLILLKEVCGFLGAVFMLVSSYFTSIIVRAETINGAAILSAKIITDDSEPATAITRCRTHESNK